MTGLADRHAGEQTPGTTTGPLIERRLPILMYHEITNVPVLPRRLSVCPDQFDVQLGYLRGSGYTSVHAVRAARMLRRDSAEWPSRPVALTFDDGFADFYETALPLLRRHEMTATLFVTTGWMAGESQDVRGSEDDRLTWDQIEGIAAAGIEIAAHTQSHPQLDQIPPDALRRELTGSKHRLEDHLGQAVTGLSYPFGYSNRRVREAAVEAGYEYACVVANRVAAAADDPYALPRLTVGRTTRLPGFARAVGSGRLPAQYLGYRMLTRGWPASGGPAPR